VAKMALFQTFAAGAPVWKDGHVVRKECVINLEATSSFERAIQTHAKLIEPNRRMHWQSPRWNEMI